MIITFKEKGNKKYEIQNEHVDEIFNKVKEEMTKIYEQYEECDKDSLIAVIASDCLAEQIMQGLSDKFGADKIIKMLEAVEMN